MWVRMAVREQLAEVHSFLRPGGSGLAASSSLEGEMEFAAKSDGLDLIPEIYRVEREK